MPSFDCGGGRCGEFSCSSCCDDETIREYWSLFQTGIAKSDREARSIMTSRINDREALARSAPTLRADLDAARAEVARLTAEVEAMRAVVEAAERVASLSFLERSAATPKKWDKAAQAVLRGAAEIAGALDAMRARKTSNVKGGE